MKYWLLGVGSVFVFACSLSAATARLTIELSDPLSKETIPGWFRVLDADEKPIVFNELYSRGEGLRANHPARTWYSVQEKTPVIVPKGEVYVEAFSGINSERVRRKLDLRFFDRLSVKLPVPILTPLKSSGWYEGNTHLHLKGLSREDADRYLRRVSQSDRLDLVFVSHLDRARDDASYITNHYLRSDLRELGQGGVLFENGEEHRHNFGAWDEGYGHVMFLKIPELVQPVSVGKGISGVGFDFPPLRDGINQARAMGATIIWCHNRYGLEDVPNWLAGRVDAQNTFDGGVHGDYSETYYRYLNVGLSVPFSTGTDWFIYDFSRVFVDVKGGLTSGSWLEGLREGRSFISNGPLLEFHVDEVGLGERIDLKKARMVSVVAKAVGRSDFGALEFVANGEILKRIVAVKKGNQFEAAMNFDYSIGEATWMAIRSSGGGLDTDGNVVVPSSIPIRGTGHRVNEMGEALFSHTSPIYVDFKGERRFDSESAEELIAEMEMALVQILEKGSFGSNEQRMQIEDLYGTAILDLRSKISSSTNRP
jgi:hypothetical protein